MGTSNTRGQSEIRPATLPVTSNEVVNNNIPNNEANNEALSPPSPFWPASANQNSQDTNLLTTLQQQQQAITNTNLHPNSSKIREKIIKGDFIDFTTLLPKAGS